MDIVLEIILQLVWAATADGIEPRFVVHQRGGFFVGGGECFILELVDFEAEENDLRGNRRQLFHRILVELRDRGVAHIAGVEQLGVAAETAEGVLHRLEATDGFGQRIGVQGVEFVLVGFGEFRGVFMQCLDIARDRWVRGRWI